MEEKGRKRENEEMRKRGKRKRGDEKEWERKNERGGHQKTPTKQLDMNLRNGTHEPNKI